MNDRASSVPTKEQQSTKRARVRGTPKGRTVDPKAREEVRARLKDAPLRRDLLIEHLHRIQDRYGHLSAAHLVALADEMKLSMTEVYEVATFYHHFDVIKEGDPAPGSRVHRLRRVQRKGWLRARQSLHRRREEARGRDRRDGGFRPSRTRRCGLSRGTQMEVGRGRTRAEADGNQYRRGRAGHVQGPLVSRARSAPLHRRRADRGLGGRHRRDLYLPARRVPRLPRYLGKGNHSAAKESAVQVATHPFAAGSGRLYLRRGIGDDRVYRGQARHAQAAPAVRRAGGPVRPADPRTQHGDFALGARDTGKRRRLVRLPGTQRPQRPAFLLGERPREEARRASRASRDHGEGADRRILWRDAGRPPVLRLSSRRGLGRDSAGIDGRYPARLRYLEPVRLLHRLGGCGDPLGQGPRDRRRAQPDEILLRGVLRAVHALQGRHGKDAEAHRKKEVGSAALEGTFPGDDGRIHMRAGAGSSQPGAFCDEILPAGDPMKTGDRPPFSSPGEQGAINDLENGGLSPVLRRDDRWT